MEEYPHCNEIFWQLTVSTWSKFIPGALKCRSAGLFFSLKLLYNATRVLFKIMLAAEWRKTGMEKQYGNIPKLGFGLMRLPMNGGDVDIDQTKQMVDMFLEAGFTYFDTAYGYLEGKSEAAVKEALVNRYPRDRFLLATKLPAWDGVKDAEEAKAMFETSLERTGAGYFDFYLLHNLGEHRTQAFDDFGIWEFLAEKKAQGLIRNLGFSFHDKADLLDEILTAHPEMDFVQLQINYADWDNPTIESRLCYETARKHGKEIIIMEPVKGGNLAVLPEKLEDIFKAVNPDASVSSWAIRYAASLEGIITVLSGMSDISQMKDNLSYMKEFKPLSEEEREAVQKVQKALSEIPTVPCTACAYCMKGCPENIAIYGTFQAVNMLNIYGNMESASGSYTWNTEGHGWNKASACIECGKCEEVCPQHIHIREELKKAAWIFEA